MCEMYKAGTCTRELCTRAHEADERIYPNIVHAGNVMKLKNRRQNESKKGKGRKGNTAV